MALNTDSELINAIYMGGFFTHARYGKEIGSIKGNFKSPSSPRFAASGFKRVVNANLRNPKVGIVTSSPVKVGDINAAISNASIKHNSLLVSGVFSFKTEAFTNDSVCIINDSHKEAVVNQLLGLSVPDLDGFTVTVVKVPAARSRGISLASEGLSNFFYANTDNNNAFLLGGSIDIRCGAGEAVREQTLLLSSLFFDSRSLDQLSSKSFFEYASSSYTFFKPAKSSYVRNKTTCLKLDILRKSKVNGSLYFPLPISRGISFDDNYFIGLCPNQSDGNGNFIVPDTIGSFFEIKIPVLQDSMLLDGVGGNPPSGSPDCILNPAILYESIRIITQSSLDYLDLYIKGEFSDRSDNSIVNTNLDELRENIRTSSKYENFGIRQV